MVAALASSTQRQYAGPLKMWFAFCARRGTDPYKGKSNDLLIFLTEKFDEGYAYGSLNSMRAAVSLILPENTSNNNSITKFFRGVFKLRPTRPKYDEIWDVSVVFRELEKWWPLDSLDLPKLTKRLAILLALATAQRVQTLSAIRLSNLRRYTDRIEIIISDLIKTSRPGFRQKPLVLPLFQEKQRLCTMKTLEAYILITEPIRKDCDQLFLTYKKPYTSASKDTISRWIRDGLKQCGINPVYTAHSTRHASTSAALAKGLSLDIIRSTAGWSKDSEVFAKHYNRPINKGGFASTIFEDL